MQTIVSASSREETAHCCLRQASAYQGDGRFLQGVVIPVKPIR